MKSLANLTPWLAAVVVGGSVALAPVATSAVPASPPASTSASSTESLVAMSGTDPLVPYGTDPRPPYRLGYVDSNHDEINTSNGGVDVAF